MELYYYEDEGIKTEILIKSKVNDEEIELRDTDEDEIPSQPAQSEKATDTAANENVTE